MFEFSSLRNNVQEQSNLKVSKKAYSPCIMERPGLMYHSIALWTLLAGLKVTNKATPADCSEKQDISLIIGYYKYKRSILSTGLIITTG